MKYLQLVYFIRLTLKLTFMPLLIASQSNLPHNSRFVLITRESFECLHLLRVNSLHLQDVQAIHLHLKHLSCGKIVLKIFFWQTLIKQKIMTDMFGVKLTLANFLNFLKRPCNSYLCILKLNLLSKVTLYSKWAK